MKHNKYFVILILSLMILTNLTYGNIEESNLLLNFIHLYIGERIQDKYLNTFLANHILNESIELNMDPLLILAIIEIESSFKNVFGDGGDAVGFMQIHQHAAWYVINYNPDLEEKYIQIGTHENLIKYPGLQISIGMRYLKYMQDRSDFVTGISMYNGRTTKHNEYSNKVLKMYNEIVSKYLVYQLYVTTEVKR